MDDDLKAELVDALMTAYGALKLLGLDQRQELKGTVEKMERALKRATDPS